MQQLLIDAGNSRLKSALLRDGRLGRMRSAAWSRRAAPGAVGADAAARQMMAGVGAAQRILVCSVAGTLMERALRRAARAARAPAPLFIRSARRAAGVRNGYRETWRLGADRWVALIGARALLPRRAVCVVDVGTALTIDLIDAAGVHRGGLLAPGPALMIDALLRQTAGIRQRAGMPPRRRGAAAVHTVFARNTRAGLSAGAELAAAALIERAMQEARALLGRRPQLILAGGAASAVALRVRTPLRRVDDLVLRGLGVLSTGDSG